MKILRTKMFGDNLFWYQRSSSTDRNVFARNGRNIRDAEEAQEIYHELTKAGKNRKIFESENRGDEVFYDRRSGKTLIKSHFTNLDEDKRKMCYMYLTDEADPDKAYEELRKTAKKYGKDAPPVNYKEHLNKYKRRVRNTKIAAGVAGSALVTGVGYAAYKHHKNKENNKNK